MAQSDPVTAILSAGLFSAASAAGAVAVPLSILSPVAAAAVGGTALIGGGSILSSLALGAAATAGSILLQQSFASAGGKIPALSPGLGANSADVRYSTRQPVPPKRIVYGRMLVGGALFLERAVPPYLYLGFLLCARRITGVSKIYVGANEAVFTAIVPNAVLAPIAPTATPNLKDNFEVSIRLGADDQTIDALATAITADANFRQRGIATAVCRLRHPGTYDAFVSVWGQAARPNVLFLVEGVPVYDPRKPGQARDDETTWTFSRNAALIQADYLRQPYGGRISADRIDWDRVAAAADYDDEPVGTRAGELIARHTIDGVVALNQSPFDVLQGMQTANRGFVLQSGRRVWVSSSPPDEPVATIHDGLIVGGIEFRAAKPKRDLVNRVRVQFVAPDREYQLADGPVREDAGYLAADGEVFESSLSLPFTADHRAAQRLQKQFLETARLGRNLVLGCDLSLLARASEDELIGRPVRVSSALFPQADGIYRVAAIAHAANWAALELTLTEYSAAIERGWNPQTDEKDFVITAP